MDEHADWIAVDWGTSALRVWVFGRGDRDLARLSSDDGTGRLAPGGFEPALLALIGDWLAPGRTTAVIACGALGARHGWAEAGYAAVPAAPPGLEQAVRVPARDPRLDLRILPGMSQDRPADVMRGEETQIAGFLAGNAAFDGIVCLPGTHSKWVQLSAGEVVSFRSFMTGDLFAAISGHTVLHTMLGDSCEGQESAFLEGVSEGLSNPAAITNRLFQLRAEALLHGLSPTAARARLSGLLIGVELGGARGWWLGNRVALVGERRLVSLYARALESQGVSPEIFDGEATALAGLKAARAVLKGGAP